jgi:hypothetical protein
MAHRGSHLIIFLGNKSHLLITLQKRLLVICLIQLDFHLPCFNDGICLFNIVSWFTFCTIVSLFLILFEYSHYCISDPDLHIQGISILVNSKSLTQLHCKSSIKIIQLKTCAYFCLSIGFSKAYYHDSQKQDIRIQFLRLGKEGKTTSVI